MIASTELLVALFQSMRCQFSAATIDQVVEQRRHKSVLFPAASIIEPGARYYLLIICSSI
jgi:hypothetical protein